MKKSAELKIQKAKGKRWLSAGICFIFYFLFFIADSSAQLLTANAGANNSVCLGDSILLGGNPSAAGGIPPYTYSWKPATGLDITSAANPKASPSSTTPYTFTVTDSTGATSVSHVVVSVLPLPHISAGADQTIIAGTQTVLQGSGAVYYYWFPSENMENQNTSSPRVEPGSTTTYCVAGTDAKGCTSYNCMTVEVIPSDTIIFYNAFSPNGDGVNDVLYIGNIEKYPDNKIEIFNRNGKLVFQQAQYANNWNGKVGGSALPCATYYVVLTLGEGRGKKQAAVTIIR